MSLLNHECIEVNVSPETPANASVIWLHGLGANGHDFVPIVPHLNLPKDAAVRFIFPHAPSIPVTINGGYEMPAWYDITEMDIEREVDEAQLRNSANEVVKFIQDEQQRGIASERIIIAGFSQGGAVAYEAAISHPEKLAGLLALSTYFATAKSCARSEANQDLPIAIYHGIKDPIVPAILSERALHSLRGWGYTIDYKTYPIEHNVSEEEIEDISNWFNERLS